MTSAWRGATATPSVVHPAVTVDTEASFRASVNFPFRRSSIQVFHAVDEFRFLRVSFCSNFGVGVIKSVQVGRHQDRVFIHVVDRQLR